MHTIRLIRSAREKDVYAVLYVSMRLVDEYGWPCFLDVWRDLAVETGTTVAHRRKSVEIAPIVYCIQYRY